MKRLKYLVGFFIMTVGTVLLLVFQEDIFPQKVIQAQIETQEISLPADDLADSDSVKVLPEYKLKPDSFEYLGVLYEYFILDTRTQEIDFLLADKQNENIAYLDSAVHHLKEKGQSPIFATNAGIFKPDFMPEGLFINQAEVRQKLNTESGKGNFYLKPNGVFFIRYAGLMGVAETSEFEDSILEVEYATQSGPLLLHHGQIHPKFNQGSPNLRVRSGVGIIAPYKAVFLLSKAPVNFYDFATTFRDQFGCQDALYLDGVISDFYFKNAPLRSYDQKYSGIIVISEALNNAVQ